MMLMVLALKLKDRSRQVLVSPIDHRLNVPLSLWEGGKGRAVLNVHRLREPE